MRSSRLVFIIFALAVLLIDASGSSAALTEPQPIQPGLSERMERRLIQFEVRVAQKGVPVRGLTAKDLDIELGGKPLKNFTVDDMCGDRSNVAYGASETRPGSSIFYFDDPELTHEGRLRTVTTC